jgi:tRNA pseudouridine32 synthase / 23S rRNA pseudouridine746 synthase
MGLHHMPHVHFQDDALLVLEKPAGLLCVPGKGSDKQDCLSTRAQAIWPDALIVHRLDMATSGLVVMARNIEAQRFLSHAFEKRQVHKQYEAIAWGGLCNADLASNAVVEGLTPNRCSPLTCMPDANWQTIDLPIAADWEQRPLRKVCTTGKPSSTQWRALQHGAHNSTSLPGQPTTRIALRPLTGRTHQLRVHMQAIGHPIVGDVWYGANYPPSPRLLLHASELFFSHPITGQWIENRSIPPF